MRWINEILRPLREALGLLREINRKADNIMTNQEQLNALGQRLEAATTGIRDDIQVLKDAAAAGEPLDFSPLEQRVTALEGLDAENPAPVEPPA